ncbi:GNAT family N-acetyltransferase [Azospirillum palustre]
MKLLLDQPQRVAAFVAERCGTDFSASPFTAIGAEMGGQIVAGCVFSLYQHPDVHVSVAVDPAGRACVRPLMLAGARYAFNQLRCARITAEIAEGNRASRAGAERMGFRVEGIKPRAMPDGSGKLILGLLPEDFRFWR